MGEFSHVSFRPRGNETKTGVPEIGWDEPFWHATGGSRDLLTRLAVGSLDRSLLSLNALITFVIIIFDDNTMGLVNKQ